MKPAALVAEKMGRSLTLALAAIIFIAVAGLIAFTARDPGLTWDEAIYFGFALRYLRWFGELSAASFDPANLWEYWGKGQVHPPLGSLWIALNMRLFGGTLDIIAAARLGAGVVFGLVAAVLFFWVASKRGVLPGIISVAAFVLMPRIFAHGHFANLEMLTVLLWLLTTVAFERGVSSWQWSIACGFFFGLGLLTKINAALLPVVLVPWGLAFHGRKAVRNLVAMALIGPLVFVAGWPAMWHHPLAHVRAYLADKASRMIIPAYYLGVAYKDRFAPWHYPFVMFIATTPLPVITWLVWGIRSALRGFRLSATWRLADHEALMLWSFAVPVLVLAAPGVPKYDGVRLMLPAFPFAAALAGAGAAHAWESVKRRLTLLGVLAVLVAIALLWLVLPLVAFYPYHLCYYGELVGGPWGAQRLGFETTYWSETLDAKALRYLNENVPRNGTVALVAVGEFIWQYYRALGEVRADIRLTDFENDDWDYLVVVPRQGWLTEAQKAFMGSHRPVWVNGLPPFGAPPICLIYRR